MSLDPENATLSGGVLFCKAQFIGNTYNYLYLVIIKLTQVWIHRNMTFYAD